MNEVTVERDGGVAILTLDAPVRRNALTPAMAGELIDACAAIDGAADVGAVVVRGAGGSFCAGADLETLASVGEEPGRRGALRGSRLDLRGIRARG